MKSNLRLYSLLLLLAGFTASCSDDKTDDTGSDQPTAAPVFTSFSPERGKGGDLLTVTGEHFGSNASRITVLVNNTPAVLSAVSDTRIEAIVPEECGTGEIRIGVRRTVSGSENLFEHRFPTAFTYIRASGVTTYAGVSGAKGQYTFGSLLTSKLFAPGQLVSDAADNLYLSEWNRGIRQLVGNQTSQLMDFFHTGANLGGFGTGDWVSDFKGLAFSPTGDRCWLLGARPTSRGAFLGYTLKSENYANYYGDSSEDMDGMVGIAVNPVDGTIVLVRNVWGPFEQIYTYDPETHTATHADWYTQTWANSESHPVWSKDGTKLFILHQSLHYISRYDYDPQTKAFSNEIEEFAGKKDLQTDESDPNRLIKGYGAGYADGQGGEARFNTPQWGCCDDAGNLYVTDRRNHCIRRIDPDGNVTTLAGVPCPDSDTNPAAFQNGGLAEAVFNQPAGIAIDLKGNIYVSEEEFADIRKITIGNDTEE